MTPANTCASPVADSPGVGKTPRKTSRPPAQWQQEEWVQGCYFSGLAASTSLPLVANPPSVGVRQWAPKQEPASTAARAAAGFPLAERQLEMPVWWQLEHF